MSQIGGVHCRELRVVRPAGLGDILMCTPALREFKVKYPDQKIIFYTGYAELITGLPYIDVVLPAHSSPNEAITLSYNHAVYKRRHFAEAIGDLIGVIVTDVTPNCVLSHTQVARFSDLWRSLPRPWIVIQREASRWTPNRNWPPERWHALIPELLRMGTVIEIGHPDEQTLNPYLKVDNYLDLRGVGPSELVASIAAADLLIGPDSGPMHVAAAVNTPAVIILGGYLLPENTRYPLHVILSTSPTCSPCFLRDPCPHNLDCLTHISVAAVLQSVVSMWRSGARDRGGANDIEMENQT